MKALIRLIAFTVIILLGTQSALEKCVHVSTPSNTHLISSSGDHSQDTDSQTSDHDCFCSLNCQVSIKLNNQRPHSLTLIDYKVSNSYPEKFLTTTQFSRSLTKPPIA